MPRHVPVLRPASRAGPMCKIMRCFHKRFPTSHFYCSNNVHSKVKKDLLLLLLLLPSNHSPQKCIKHVLPRQLAALWYCTAQCCARVFLVYPRVATTIFPRSHVTTVPRQLLCHPTQMLPKTYNNRFVSHSAMLEHDTGIGGMSVRLSVTCWYCLKTNNHRIMQFSPTDSWESLVFLETNFIPAVAETPKPKTPCKHVSVPSAVILLLLLVCVSWTIIGQPRNSIFIRMV